MQRLKALTSPKVIRWFVVGFIFAAFGIGMVKLFAGVLQWPYTLATAASGELGTIFRFFAVDRWVFGHQRPTFTRFWQYHVAGAAGFGIWWTASNLLKLTGIDYLLASILGMCFSVGFSALSNFFWIWRKSASRPSSESSAAKRFEPTSGN